MFEVLLTEDEAFDILCGLKMLMIESKGVEGKNDYRLERLFDKIQGAMK